MGIFIDEVCRLIVLRLLLFDNLNLPARLAARGLRLSWAWVLIRPSRVLIETTGDESGVGGNQGAYVERLHMTSEPPCWCSNSKEF